MAESAAAPRAVRARSPRSHLAQESHGIRHDHGAAVAAGLAADERGLHVGPRGIAPVPSPLLMYFLGGGGRGAGRGVTFSSAGRSSSLAGLPELFRNSSPDEIFISHRVCIQFYLGLMCYSWQNVGTPFLICTSYVVASTCCRSSSDYWSL